MKQISYARTVWRITRLVARHYDRRQPFWWRDSRVIEAVFSGRNDIATRCWKQHIEQRIGKH